MKKMTRALSIAVVAIMTFCLCAFNVTVSAAGTANMITINAPSSGTLIGQTYTAYKVFAASVSGADANAAYTYTLDDGCIITSGKYTNGTKDYMPADLSSGDAEAKAALTREFANFLYNTYIKSGATGTMNPNTIHRSVTITNEMQAPYTIDVTNEPGYYVVVGSVKTNDGTNSIVQSLAMLDTASDKAGATMTPKVELPHFTNEGKQAKKDGANDGTFSAIMDSEIGDVLEYRIGAVVPDTTGYENYTYSFVDTISDGLEYDNISYVKLYKGNGTSNEITNNFTKEFSNSNKTLTVAVNVKALVNAGTVTASDTIYLRYKAKVVSGATKYAVSDADDAKSMNNTVHLAYPNDPYGTTTANTPDNNSDDYTYGFEVDKIKKSGSSSLAGAEFKISKTSGGDGLYFVNTATSGEMPVYKLSASGATGATQTLTGDSNGKFKVYGFDSVTDYYLEETKAPDGYGKISTPIQFRISATLDATNKITSLTIGGTDRDDVDFDNTSGMVIKVKNDAGTQLVGTGGIGTTVFYVCGGILMAGAIILLVTKLRMKNK